MSLELYEWTKKILILIGISLLAYITYLARDIFFIILVSGFLTIIINPLVDYGERYNIPSWVTTTVIFIIIFLLGTIVIGTLIPIIISYISDSI